MTGMCSLAQRPSCREKGRGPMPATEVVTWDIVKSRNGRSLHKKVSWPYQVSHNNEPPKIFCLSRKKTTWPRSTGGIGDQKYVILRFSAHIVQVFDVPFPSAKGALITIAHYVKKQYLHSGFYLFFFSFSQFFRTDRWLKLVCLHRGIHYKLFDR